MSMGYEKTILLYSSATYETADIISSYIYRVGLQEQSWSYSTAIGLLNSVINCILLVVTNKISKRVAATVCGKKGECEMASRKKIRQSASVYVFQVFNYCFLSALVLMCLYQCGTA